MEAVALSHPAAPAHPRSRSRCDRAARLSFLTSSSGSHPQLRRCIRFSRAQSARPLAAVTARAAEVATLEEVEFRWEGSASEVTLTGDFLNWNSQLELAKVGDALFIAKQKLPPGKYLYKFIVDGVWQHSPLSPTSADGAGGFNNVLTIEEKKPAAKADAPAEAPAAPAAGAPEAAKPAAAKKAAAPAGKAAAPAGKAAGKEAAAKPIGAAMEEDIIPALRTNLDKEEGLESLSLVFDNNALRGSFIKNGIPYDFWAYFPDGTLEGARGFSLTSCGNPPSTVEPFIIDEKKITPDLVVFWVTKRLFMQKLLSLN